MPSTRRNAMRLGAMFGLSTLLLATGCLAESVIPSAATDHTASFTAASPETAVRAASATDTTATSRVAVESSVPVMETATTAPPPIASLTSTAGWPETEIANIAFAEINRQRAAVGLALLHSDGRLMRAATDYASVVLHLDPYLGAAAHSLDGEPWDRATSQGYSWSKFAENLGSSPFAQEQVDANAAGQGIVALWMNSASHRANILAPEFVDAAVGCALGPALTPRPEVARVLICAAEFAVPR